MAKVSRAQERMDLLLSSAGIARTVRIRALEAPEMMKRPSLSDAARFAPGAAAASRGIGRRAIGRRRFRCLVARESAKRSLVNGMAGARASAVSRLGGDRRALGPSSPSFSTWIGGKGDVVTVWLNKLQSAIGLLTPLECWLNNIGDRRAWKRRELSKFGRALIEHCCLGSMDQSLFHSSWPIQLNEG
jgi:hypothetical protein